jgi:hypothetical protein
VLDCVTEGAANVVGAEPVQLVVVVEVVDSPKAFLATNSKVKVVPAGVRFEIVVVVAVLSVMVSTVFELGAAAL